MTSGRNLDCFNSLILTINGILELWDQLKAENASYLLTSRLNQDKIKNFFGSMRSRSGHNDNPTVMQFRNDLKNSAMNQRIDDWFIHRDAELLLIDEL
ncbi:hypothetical protein TSAR_013537 [Trichomalopsis sarcophagae]|uniref:Transposable element P transposase-like RNase H C-terminal domain-containing protein n=1 Tax=Trichomalopsis sarcophagae TaxID=543379 RepID=A0A232EFB6_9HYME|nr:hypothetical protein TSAR_013537 [Trichomalopsis sarcophagae]